MEMDRGTRLLSFLFFALSATFEAAGQEPTPAHAGHGQSAAQAAEPPPLFDNLGKFHREITTASPQAQKYFDQGLRLIWAFNHDEAQRAFEHAAGLDPSCAMCWWGVGYTLGPNINLPALPDRAKAAHEASRKALRLAPNASPVEKALIEALQKRYSAVPPTGPDGQKALDTAFAGAMREASRRFPDDLDVATLSAEAMMNLRPWKLWTLDGKPEPGTLEILSTLERVMARDPSHPGANHYYIHAVEASPQPEKGLEAARRLPALVPGAGHIVHMPAHIYIRTGRYAETSEANRRAIRSEEAYAAAAKPSPMYQLMYIVHNYQFLWAATMMEGRSAESIRAARDSVRESSREMIRQMPGYDFLLTYPPLALLRFGRWEEVLKEPAPPEEFSFATAMWHHSRAVALAKLGRADEASAELKKLDAILTSTKPDAMQALNSAASLLTIASKVSAAQIATARGERARAVSLLEEAVSAEDRLNYNEPSDWYYPVRHTLGALLLSSGRPKEAEAVYRKDLERYPENGWSLYGLAQSLSAQKKAADAARVRKRFEAAWKNADVQIAGSEF